MATDAMLAKLADGTRATYRGGWRMTVIAVTLPLSLAYAGLTASAQGSDNAPRLLAGTGSDSPDSDGNGSEKKKRPQWQQR